MKFSSNPKTSVKQVPQPPISKSIPPYSVAPSFFKEYLNPQVRINKIANKHSVNYHCNSSGLTSIMHPPMFLQTLYRFQGCS